MHENPRYGLRPFLEAQVKEFETDFFKNYDIKIAFDESAREKIIAMADKEGKKIHDLLETILMDYVYGLRIIASHTGKDEFLLTKENLDHPRDILDQWVKEALKGK